MPTFIYVPGGVTEFTVVGSGLGVNAAADFLIPADALPGDIFLGFDVSSSGVPVVNADFVEIATTSNVTIGISSYRIVEAGDEGTTFTGMSGGTTRKSFVLLRPDDDFVTLTIAGLTANAFPDVSTTRSQDILASGQSTPLVAIGMIGATGGATDGSSPAFDGQANDALTISVTQWTVHNTSPVDHDVSWTGTIRHMHTFYLQVS